MAHDIESVCRLGAALGRFAIGSLGWNATRLFPLWLGFTAIAKTFDGRHPCPLCKAIAKGDRVAKETGLSPGNGKIDMDFRRPSALLYPPRLPRKWRSVAANALAFFVEPSAPPPKAA